MHRIEETSIILMLWDSFKIMHTYTIKSFNISAFKIFTPMWSDKLNKLKFAKTWINPACMPFNILKTKNLFSYKMCLWNTMPPIMANSNEGQDDKDKYFDTSRKISSQEMTMCNMEALVSYPKEVMTNVIFFNWSNAKFKRLSTYKKISSQGIFMWNIKALALTFQKFLATLKFLKSRSNSQVNVTRLKTMEPKERSYHKGYSCEISKL